MRVDWLWTVVALVVLTLVTAIVWSIIHSQESYKHNCRVKGGDVVQFRDVDICVDDENRIIVV